MYMYSIIDHYCYLDHHIVMVILSMITVSLCIPRGAWCFNMFFHTLEDSSMGSSPDSSTMVY